MPKTPALLKDPPPEWLVHLILASLALGVFLLVGTFPAQLRVVQDQTQTAERNVTEVYVPTPPWRPPAIDVKGIREEYDTLNTSIAGTCLPGVDLFFLFSGAGSPYFLIQVQCGVRPKQCAALGSLNKSAVAVKAGLAELKTSVEALEGAVSRNNVDETYTRLANTKRAAASLQVDYSALSAAYTLLAEGDGNEQGYLYAFGGARYNCRVTTSVSRAFTSLSSLTRAAKPPPAPTTTSVVAGLQAKEFVKLAHGQPSLEGRVGY